MYQAVGIAALYGRRQGESHADMSESPGNGCATCLNLRSAVDQRDQEQSDSGPQGDLLLRTNSCRLGNRSHRRPSKIEGYLNSARLQAAARTIAGARLNIAHGARAHQD